MVPTMEFQNSTKKMHQNGLHTGAITKAVHQKISLVFECIYTFLINFYPTGSGRVQPETLLSNE
mgnify:CR=1 FL=1